MAKRNDLTDRVGYPVPPEMLGHPLVQAMQAAELVFCREAAELYRISRQTDVIEQETEELLAALTPARYRASAAGLELDQARDAVIRLLARLGEGGGR